MGLTTCCLYGGSPYNAQEMKLKRGVDVVVGTPGRVKVTTNYFNNSHLIHTWLLFKYMDMFVSAPVNL